MGRIHSGDWKMSKEVWDVAMPKLGETVTEGVVGRWLKQAGETVQFDEPLFEVSTDKVDSEIPSPYDGVVLEILVPEGQTVPVGTALVRIGPPGADLPSYDADPPAVGGSEGPTTAYPEAAFVESGVQPAPVNAAGDVYEVTMPKLGETVTEGTLSNWLKHVGDRVAFDDPLFEVSTDKVDSEIPSPYDGVVLEILVPAGQTVPVGTMVARIGEPGAAVGPAAAPSAAAPAAAPAAVAGAPAPAARIPGATGDGKGPGALSPVVRRLAAESGIDLSTVRGTGLAGRIRREDVQQAIAAGPAPAAPAAPAAAPAAAAPTAAPAAAAAPAAPAAGPGDARDEVVKLSRMRVLTAQAMVNSRTVAPAQVWTSVEVDFDAIDQVRAKHKDRFKKEVGASLTYLPFIARAVSDALRAFPPVNASIDMDAQTMTYHPYVNLGIAVDVEQQGLYVVVVKDADQLNMRGIAKRITELAAAARNKKLSMADMSGSTFTITNPGPFASYASAPIINQPNVGILCTDGVKRRPVAVGSSIAIHSTGIVGLVYDHRAFDGSTASLFLLHVRDSLQDRNWEPEVG
jgi:pyruvate dehydrogenase E2 component (dihydrolipoamide acetyltransferase)